MAEVTKKFTKIKINGKTFEIPTEQLLEDLGLTLQELATLLTRDFYTPTLNAKPSQDTLSYRDNALGEDIPFRTAQNCIYPDTTAPDGIGMSFFVGTKAGKAVWRNYTDMINVNRRLATTTSAGLMSAEDKGYLLSKKEWEFSPHKWENNISYFAAYTFDDTAMKLSGNGNRVHSDMEVEVCGDFNYPMSATYRLSVSVYIDQGKKNTSVTCQKISGSDEVGFVCVAVIGRGIQLIPWHAEWACHIVFRRLTMETNCGGSIEVIPTGQYISSPNLNNFRNMCINAGHPVIQGQVGYGYDAFVLRMTPSAIEDRTAQMFTPNKAEITAINESLSSLSTEVSGKLSVVNVRQVLDYGQATTTVGLYLQKDSNYEITKLVEVSINTMTGKPTTTESPLAIGSMYKDALTGTIYTYNGRKCAPIGDNLKKIAYDIELEEGEIQACVPFGFDLLDMFGANTDVTFVVHGDIEELYLFGFFSWEGVDDDYGLKQALASSRGKIYFHTGDDVSEDFIMGDEGLSISGDTDFEPNTDYVCDLHMGTAIFHKLTNLD